MSRPSSRAGSLRSSQGGRPPSRARPMSRQRLDKLEKLQARESSHGRLRVAAVLAEKLIKKHRVKAPFIRAVVHEEVGGFLKKHPRITKRALAHLEKRVEELVAPLMAAEPAEERLGTARSSHGGDTARSAGGGLLGTARRESRGMDASGTGIDPTQLAETKGREWQLLDTYTYMEGIEKDQSEVKQRRDAALELNRYLQEQVVLKKAMKKKEKEFEASFSVNALDDVVVYAKEEAVAKRARDDFNVSQRVAQEQQVQDQEDFLEQERLEKEHHESLEVQWAKDNIERERVERITMIKQMRKEADKVRVCCVDGMCGVECIVIYGVLWEGGLVFSVHVFLAVWFDCGA